MSVNELPELATPREAMALLRVSYATLRRMIERGDLAAVRLGRPGSAVRIPVSELERLANPPEGPAAP